jgi:hypothetical protein
MQLTVSRFISIMRTSTDIHHEEFEHAVFHQEVSTLHFIAYGLIDMGECVFQCPMSWKSSQLASFRANGQVWCPTLVPSTMKEALPYFYRSLDRIVFKELPLEACARFRNSLLYMAGLTRIFYYHLELVFRRIVDWGFLSNPSKCQLSTRTLSWV